MKKQLPILLFLLLIAGTALAQTKDSSNAQPAADDFASRLKASITRYLGRPYIWGSSGLKSFDCSGFIWRVMNENGILIKRTTARKFYMALPKVEESDKWQFGTIVFFDDLAHVGIVDSATTFFHAQTSADTNLSKFDPFWRKKIYGFRRMPTQTGSR